MQCPRCHADSRAAARFCWACGTSFDVICPVCGVANQPAHRVCSACGEALASVVAPTHSALVAKHLASSHTHEGERKEVTVLFADVKGSMELVSGRDPEEARRLLDPILQLMMDAVHRYGGIVNQVMGDGIMALFGAPIAHEDHALRACCAALRIQESVTGWAADRSRSAPSVQVRVGINSGDVVVRSIEGGDIHSDYTAVGQATSIAARMEQLAEPGTILVTGRVVRLAGPGVSVRPLGPIPIKGLPEAHEVFELREVTHGETRFAVRAARGLTRFVGRTADLAAVGHVVRQVETGSGQVVALVGAAGVGKSRVVWELIHSEPIRAWRVLVASAASYESETVYFAVTELLKNYFGIEETDDARSIQERVTGHLQALDPALGEAVTPMLALLEALPSDSPFRRLEAPERRRRTLESMNALLARESRSQPVLLVIEDLQWIDSASRTLLESVVDRLPASRVLLVTTFRPEYQPPWAAKPCCTQLRIDPLPSDLAHELLDSLLGEHPELGPLKELLVKRCAGNPFYLEETVRTLLEEGVLRGVAGAYELVQSPASVRVPASVQAVLTARIDRLAPEDKELLQTAAVLGAEVPRALLEMTADRPPAQVREGLTRLCAADFLHEVDAEVLYTFRHALTHEVAYGSLLLARRRALHARIVEAIERRHADRLADQVDRLAHHATRAELWNKAFDYLRMAGGNAYTRGALEEAIGRYEAALATIARLPTGADTARRSIDVRLDLHAPLMTVGRTHRIVELYPEAERLAHELDDAGRLGQVLQRMSQLAWLEGRYRTGAEHARQALTVAERSKDAVTNLHAHYFLGLHRQALGDYHGAIPCFSYVVEGPHAALASRVISVTVPMDVPGWSWLAFASVLTGDVARAEAALRRATASAEASDFAQSRVIAHTIEAIVLAHAGRPASCVATLERAVELCERIRFVVWLPALYSTMGLVLARVGRAAAGLSYLERSVAINEKLGLRTYHGQRYAWWAEGLLGAGQLAEARKHADTAVEIARSMEERGVEAEALLVRARIACALGADLEARAYFERVLSAATPLGVRLIEAHGHLGLAEVLHRAGETAAAGVHRDTANRTFRETGATPWWREC
jgi:class 3 adenylate cyclase/tetratricopeptide (TPR) repeat protein